MMGGWLARLKNGIGPATHATKATETPQGDAGGVSVGFVACSPAPLPEIEARAVAVNDTATADPDRWCWPHSEAMNGREIDAFTSRLARFTDKGLPLMDAEQQTDRLTIRDREGDVRRLCLECAHLQGIGPWGCGNWRKADVCMRSGDAALARDLVLMLQRCDGFKTTTP